MDYFPAFLNLHSKSCLLVGGGEIAARKARLLLAAGARPTVVAPELGAAVAELVATGSVCHIPRCFHADDLHGHWLVVCATNAMDVQRTVHAAAERARIFCNSVDDTANCSYITPAIVDRSPIVVAVSSGGAAPLLARQIRTRIEAALPQGIGRLARMARRWRDRVKEQLGEVRQRRLFWESFFDGRVANAVYAHRGDAAEQACNALLEAAAESNSARGQAWLVGAGPGDPGLLTLRALQIMQSADVIVHDRLVSTEVLSLARRDAERVPVGKTPGGKRNSQGAINSLLVRLVAEGKRVCRLKGGDPFIFGRGGEEADALAVAGLPCEVVPGITAAAGCAAYSGIPLTHRDASQSVVLLTAHGKNSIDRLDWKSLARDRQTLAIYMAVQNFPLLMRKLIAHGRPPETPVAIVENGTTPQQRVIRGSLGQLTLLAAAHRIEAPAMLFIGAVAKFGQDAAAPSANRSEAASGGESAIQKAVHIQ